MGSWRKSRESPRSEAGRRTLGPVPLLLAVAFLLALAALVRLFPDRRPPPGDARTGDGTDVDSYGFDLERCLVPRDEIAAGGFAKGALSEIDFPRLLGSAAAVDSINQRMRGKYLVSRDRVVGVRIGGVARAYPLRVLAWHEVVNDTIGGEPVAVTYSPLSEGAVLFDRRLCGEVLAFRVSGLLYDSNLLFYDVRPLGNGESLWSQLGARAVAGPRAGDSLGVLPMDVVAWGEWRARHPETTVIAGDRRLAAAYNREPYANYFGSERLRFPAAPLPPEGGLPRKTRILALRPAGRWIVFPFPVIAARAGAGGVWRTVAEGVPLRIVYDAETPSARVVRDGPGGSIPSILAFYFAWYAVHDGEVSPGET